MCDLTLERKLRGRSIITSGCLFFQSSTNLKEFQRALTGYKVLVDLFVFSISFKNQHLLIPSVNGASKFGPLKSINWEAKMRLLADYKFGSKTSVGGMILLKLAQALRSEERRHLSQP